MIKRVKSDLELVLQDRRQAWFVGGSLDLGYAWVNTNGKVHWVDGTNYSEQLDEAGHRLICEIYVKNKDKDCAFYQRCMDVLEFKSGH